MNKDKVDKAIELMKNEKACIIKADTCDGNCAKCELLRDTKNLLSAYDMAIQALEQELCEGTISRTEAKKLAIAETIAFLNLIKHIKKRI